MSNPNKMRVHQNQRGVIKVTVVGDTQVGKTCLLLTYVTKQYPACVPASFEWHMAGTGIRQGTYPHVVVDGQKRHLDFADTLGLDDYRSLRHLEYMTTDVFVVCFDISRQETLRNAQEKWIPEVRGAQPHVPFILVGTKLDLRNDPEIMSDLDLIGQTPVEHEEGKLLARAVKAADYVECSSLNDDGVRSVFLSAAHAACMARKEQSMDQQVKEERGCKCVVS